MTVKYENTDFFKILFQLKGSIFDNAALKLIITIVVSLTASTLHHYLDWFKADNTGPVGPINKLGFTLAGSAIAFLLVFRSSISYSRFWEGRGHLGDIMHHARDLGRQMAFCLLNDEGEGEKDIMVRMEAEMSRGREGREPNLGEYQETTGVRENVHRMCGFRRLQMIRTLLIFWRLLVQHARGDCKLDGIDERLLNYSHAEFKLMTSDGKAKPTDPCIRKLAIPVQMDLLHGKPRRPLIAVGMMTWYLQQEYRAKNITYMEYMSMNDNLNGLIEGFNGVDKITSVPVPFPYAQMILVFLSLYCFSAPFLFVTSFGWACVVPSLILSLAFFGINEVAIEIEEPFGDDDNDLPTDGMGDALTKDCEMNLKVAGVPVSNLEFYWNEIAKSVENSATKNKLKEVQAATGVSSGGPALSGFSHPSDGTTTTPFLLKRASRARKPRRYESSMAADESVDYPQDSFLTGAADSSR